MKALQKNNQVTKLTIYRNQVPVRNKIDLQTIDTVVFTSPFTVHNFKKLYRSIPEHLDYQVIGPTTAEALKHAKL